MRSLLAAVCVLAVVAVQQSSAGPACTPLYRKLCRVSDWSVWSPKDNIFGCSRVFRTRTVIDNPLGSTACCPALREEKEQCGVPTREQTVGAMSAGFLGPLSGDGFRKADGSTGKIDVLFVFDKSGSVREVNFNDAKQNIQNLIEDFPAPVDPDNTRVAAISFSDVDKTRVEFDFNESGSRDEVRAALGSIAYERGWTATATALSLARDNVFQSVAGSRADSAKILFLITDGKSNRGGAPIPVADQLKANDVEMFAFAVGPENQINEDELRSIVSDPVPEHLFYADSFSSMSGVFTDLITILRERFGGSSFSTSDDEYDYEYGFFRR
ncbi:SVEP1 [Branchiostoma lanceolatum]|uniref:SVEP1 protein n=1 Tax=Branchiostoma lanceolatum TaxID=7740 RepID=A0A8K0ABX2_BRALA|nr:SVEP1 [Branchiostoma lanceolatum]